MNFQHLEYFNELARTQYMAKAAENLGISQPTLSYAVKKLEEELGVPLFEREGRNIKLTIYGEVFSHYTAVGVEQIIAGQKRLHQMAQGNIGRISIGIAHMVSHNFIIDVIREYRKINPDYKVDFNLKRDSTMNLLQMIADEYLDLAVVIDTGNEKHKYQGVQIQPIMYRNLQLVVPEGHELAGKGPVSIKEVANYPYIGFSESSGMRHFIKDFFDQNSVNPQLTSETDDMQTMLDLVSIDEGIALLPKSRYHIEPGVVSVPLIEDTSYTISLASKSIGNLSKVAKDMSKFIDNYCKEHNLVNQ